MRILAIAQNTFREARRDRAQWILLLYAVVVVGAASVLNTLAMGEGHRVTRDLGLAAMSLVGVILIILVGSGLIQKEIERRTILTVLAKPVRRFEFLIGKYLGLMMMVSMIFGGMVVLLAGVLWLQESRLEPAVFVAAGFTYGELAIMTAVVVTFSSFVSPAIAGVFTLALFVMGHFASDLLRFAERAETVFLAVSARAVYLLLPHLDVFNLRAEAAYGVLPDSTVVLNAAGYAVLYSACLIAVGCGIFSRREFR
jgi:ABC-type transport system involved in multi-copper enzyme maturation permease subunit